MATDEINLTPAVKPGYKTSEFWLTAAANIVGMLLATGAICTTDAQNATPWCKLFGIVVMILTTLGYQVTRASVKKA